MTITLAVGAVSIDLPADMYWTDENWSPVVQTANPTITGALVLQAAERTAGRPITLSTIDTESGWMTAETLLQLRTWSAIAILQMLITLRGVTRTVVFRHQDVALDANPVVHYSDVQDGDFYTVTTRFMEI